MLVAILVTPADGLLRILPVTPLWLLGPFLIWLAVRGVQRGYINSRGGSYSQQHQPIQFYTQVAFYVALGIGVMAFGVYLAIQFWNQAPAP
jgi:hypothetical protein